MADPYEPPQPSSSDRFGHATNTLARIVLARRRQQRREMRQFGTRLAVLLGALATVVITGAIGYSIDEHTSIGYGFFWTLDSVKTLGEVPAPGDTAGRLILVGVEGLGEGYA